MKKGIRLATLLLIVVMSSRTDEEGKATVKRKDEKPRAKVTDVIVCPVDQIQDYTAMIKARVKNNIAPLSPTRIDRILVEAGNRASKGQELVQMNAANLTQTKLQLDNQKIGFNHIGELYKVDGAPKSEWDTAKIQLDMEQTAYNNLVENIFLLGPINGVVTARNYDNDDMYSGGSPVLVVEQIIPVKLMINVSETYFMKVEKDEPVDVRLDVYGDGLFKETISLIYPTIDATTRTSQIGIKLDGKDQRVRSEMFTRTTPNFGTTDNAIIPNLTIVKQTGSGDHYAYVYKDGKVSYNKVELGRRIGSEYELGSGVSDSSQVVVVGQAHLISGTEVEIEK